MTRKDVMNEIADRPPVEQPETQRPSSGGPGMWAALITVLGVILILTLSTVTAVQQTNRDQRSAAANASILRSQEEILAEIRAAVQAGPADTENAILALINDNRRIHGCKPVAAISQLASAPTCLAVQAVSTTVPARPAATVPAASPTTLPPAAPSTTTTTVPAKGSDKDPPGLVKKLLDLLL